MIVMFIKHIKRESGCSLSAVMLRGICLLRILQKIHTATIHVKALEGIVHPRFNPSFSSSRDQLAPAAQLHNFLLLQFIITILTLNAA